ncbi:MAG: hypothetical protein QNJ46_04260 [Leptolyngbyaceae cyanobacterium MO_188.B28]|nr:hypothetical protein [Leptolyngbyaceae cyanobacterium MO_188.B28]
MEELDEAFGELLDVAFGVLVVGEFEMTPENAVTGFADFVDVFDSEGKPVVGFEKSLQLSYFHGNRVEWWINRLF